MKFFAFITVISLATSSLNLPQRVHLRVIPPPPGGGRNLDLDTDLTYLGAVRLGQAIWQSNHGAAGFALRRVSGQTHWLIGQGGIGQFYWPNCPTEWIDPGTYSKTMASTTVASVYNHWGYTNSDKYDCFHGLFGKTYDATGLVGYGGTNHEYDNNQWGLFWTDESSNCCLLVTYGLPYGNYDPGAAMLVMEFTTFGSGSPSFTGMTTTTIGPIRTCQGVSTPGGSDEICGDMRAEKFTKMPDNSWGTTQGPSSTQQGGTMKGASLFGGLAFPNMSSTGNVGWGSTRAGNPLLRTTDLVFPNKYLAHYNMDSTIFAAGVASTPLWTMRRPPHVSTALEPWTQYVWEGVNCADPASTFTAGEIDPTTNDNIGTYTSGDGMGGGIYIPGTVHGFLNFGNFNGGHGWYKTRACLDFYRDATEAKRDILEPTVCGSNKNFSVVKNGSFGTLARVRIVNDGASQPLTVTVSGADVTVHAATNGSGVITSTANDVIDKINTTSASSSLVTASLSVEAPDGAQIPGDGCSSGDGSGLVEAIDYRKLAGGPQNCPLHNIPMGYDVTGPGTTRLATAIINYDMSALPATPDYSPEPQWSWLGDRDNGEVLMSRALGPVMEPCGNPEFDPVTRKLYALCGYETTTDATPRPFMNVWQVAGEASAPADLAVAEQMKANATYNDQLHLMKVLQQFLTQTGFVSLFLTIVLAVRRKKHGVSQVPVAIH